MDDQTRAQWRLTLAAIKWAAQRVVREDPPQRRPRYPDWLIVAMYHWAGLHGRCPSWACDRSHYSGAFRPRTPLPSVSQFNRRMNKPRTQRVMDLAARRLGGGDPSASSITYLDGMPLTVGPASKDPEARKGHVMGGFAKGYKLHAWVAEDRRIPLWSVAPLNLGEMPAALAMAGHLWREGGGVALFPPDALTLADQNYDGHDLHKALAALGTRLLVVPKGRPDGARHPVTLRQMGEARRELLAVYAAAPGLVRLVHRGRANVEGALGNLCSGTSGGGGGGLTRLPPWARRLHRVTRWVGALINLYNARVLARAQARKAAAREA